VKGEQRDERYRALNPQALVPMLVDDGETITQSMAIIEYLDEKFPDPPLLPPTPEAKARVRSIAQVIACDIHPLNNLRVLKYLTGTLGASEDAKNAWYRHWIELGLAAIEARLAADTRTGSFCHGATPTLADICLVPQLANARRYDFSIEAYPTLGRIESHCLVLDAFARAAPARQPDAA
jgi:maleylpyruvate isomerase